MLHPQRVRSVLGPAEAREDVLGHPRARPRADGVDAYAVPAEGGGRRRGEADDAALGGRVVGLAGRAGEERLGRGVDDPAVDRGVRGLGALAPVGGGEPGGGEVAPQVDPDDGVPFVLGHREHHPVPQDAGVVDQDVERPVRADRQPHQVLRLVEVGDVPVVRHRVAAGGGDLGDDLVRGARRRLAGAVAAGLPVVVDDHVGAQPRQFQRLGAAEASSRPRDDGGPAVQYAHGFPRPGVRPRCRCAGPRRCASGRRPR